MAQVEEKAKEEEELVLGNIDDNTTAFSHVPEHGFSLFLARRTKTIHFIRHAEGRHNEANRATDKGVQQCVDARQTLLHGVNPQLIVVSPFTRTLQTAHLMFAGKNIPFLVHHLCSERSGKFTCDKKRNKEEILGDIEPIYEYTGDRIDFQHGFPTDDDQTWSQEREPSDVVTKRGIDLMHWLATRPETEIAVVTHSSWLKHLFRAFGKQVADKDMETMHRLSGNAEVRSICLALHKGFYPEGVWDDMDHFVPNERSFRRGRWAPNAERMGQLHKELLKKSLEK